MVQYIAVIECIAIVAMAALYTSALYYFVLRTPEKKDGKK